MKYCLIGKSLGHSYSKIIHNECGLDYSLVELSPNELEGFFKRGEFSGFNVTIPYKKDVIKYINVLSKTASKAGAVNTVLNKNGVYYGYNTDVGGMEYMIYKTGVTLEDKNVLILGSGGTSNTAKTLCEIKGSKSVNVVSRTGDINYDNCYDLINTQIIINTTPVGMFPNFNDCPIALEKFNNLQGVFDCVYNPLETKLIKNAKSLNIPCSSGLTMLVKQALLAQEIWLDKKIDNEQEITNHTYKNALNICLCGMPSAGKTTIGKQLALFLNKDFYDSDNEIFKAYNKTPSQIITEYGEDYFRDIESKIIKELSLKTNAVISLGGGAVIKNENVNNLKFNSKIIYIERDLNLLTTKDRPLSVKMGIETLYNKRNKIYTAVSDFKVKNDKEVLDAVKRIINYYENISY